MFENIRKMLDSFHLIVHNLSNFQKESFYATSTPTPIISSKAKNSL